MLQAEANDRREAEAPLQNKPVVVKFGGQAGAPVPGVAQRPSAFAQYNTLIGAPVDNPYHPFKSKIDWEFADWAKDDDPGSSSLTRLLGIEDVCDRLKLSYQNSKDLNQIIDKKLPNRPAFKHVQVEVDGEICDAYLRDIMECIAALFGAPELAPSMVYAPERHYVDPDRTIRAYSDMHTGKWWWAIQHRLENVLGKAGATIIPVIISSDKTQLTLFRNKSAYPVYLTLGNIPKDIRRKPSRQAQVLLGYLPVTRLGHIRDDDIRRRALVNLFHACLKKATGPLKQAGIDGVEMMAGDGTVHRCHPIFAAYIADYPEQVLVTCTKSGLCPQGLIKQEQMGENVECEPRDMQAALAALATLDDGDPVAFVDACAEAHIKPVFHPFWEDLPFADVFLSITPDILHQLYQGVLKHLISWIKKAYGAAVIDARFERMPPNHNLRLFSKGISHLSRVSGTEHQDICRVLLGAIIGLPLPGGHSPARLVRAVRGLLDFAYMAQFPAQTDQTLELQRNALSAFHSNKAVFVDLGIRAHFNFPKMHGIMHFVPSVPLFGTADNFNTSYSERLHIDFTKDAYRATNRKDEYPQMTLWLQRREKMHRHKLFIQWRLENQPAIDSTPPPLVPKFHLQVARFPTVRAVSFQNAELFYGAADLEFTLARFIVGHVHPNFTAAQTLDVAAVFRLPFRSVAVYHRVKFWNSDAQGRENVPETLDSIHVRPAYRDTQGRVVPGRFDTALIRIDSGAEAAPGVAGYRVGQVRLIFSLSQRAVEAVFPEDKKDACPPRLAYVEWFSRFPRAPEANHRMYRTSRARDRNDRRLASIIPVTDIERSVHLIPKFGISTPPEWTSANVLELCPHFFTNTFTDRHTYLTVY
ncbi:hypothetical protein BV25DRAFT_1794108 [Artomyces pyxidatus]|uniref:Uncharacterized protein n=1 Tax=Artomyces pyxidatus TaxID=48021 RepID=A0ACB8TH86_9AGAM|nr:hypothetical protein BV25DRAFT_1794108 [Artomyces pyxidatus]